MQLAPPGEGRAPSSGALPRPTGIDAIRRATALAFARAGANVAVADIAEQRNAETAKAIDELGVRSLALAATWEAATTSRAP